MDDKLSQREKACLIISSGPWLVVLAQVAFWIRDPDLFSWGGVVVWLVMLFVALFLTSAALPKAPRH